MNNWFEQKPLLSKDKALLAQTYNLKYGNYDYSKDSRSLDKTFLKVFKDAFLQDEFKEIIVCGANNGYEVGLIQKLKQVTNITAVDISNIALKKLSADFSLVNCLHENLENLTTLRHKQFDIYLCLRAIHSSNINIKEALKEAVRITKNRIVLSISNGYVLNGKLVQGMYEYETKTINQQKPYVIVDEVCFFLNQMGWQTVMSESEAEINGN